MPKRTDLSKEEIERYSPSESRPNFNAQTHIDVRILSGLHRFLASKRALSGPSLSGLLETSLRVFHDTLVHQGLLTPQQSVHDAIAELRAAGYSLAQLDAAKRRNTRLVKALVAEELAAEGPNWLQIDSVNIGSVDADPDLEADKQEVLAALSKPFSSSTKSKKED